MKMQKVKDWLLGRNVQFEVLETTPGDVWINSIKRLSDGQVFNRGTFFYRNDCQIFLFRFSKDQVNVDVSVTKNFKTECGFTIPVNELETWIPKLEEDVED